MDLMRSSSARLFERQKKMDPSEPLEPSDGAGSPPPSWRGGKKDAFRNAVLKVTSKMKRPLQEAHTHRAPRREPPADSQRLCRTQRPSSSGPGGPPGERKERKASAAKPIEEAVVGHVFFSVLSARMFSERAGEDLRVVLALGSLEQQSSV
eukprot:EG_transcript_37862